MEYDISKIFLKTYGVLKVEISSMKIFSPYYEVEFLDGRKITKTTTSLNHEQIVNSIRQTIIEGGLFKNRKKKLNNITKRINGINSK